MRTPLTSGGIFAVTLVLLASCGGVALRLPSSGDTGAIDAEPEQMISGREAYSAVSRHLITLDDSLERHLKLQLSEIGLIHTDSTEISSWKFTCLYRQVAEIQDSLVDEGSKGRRFIELLKVEGIDYILADLAEHPEASENPSMRLGWWEEGEGRSVVVRAVYDIRNPDRDRRCRILKASSFERQLHQLR